MSVLPVFDPPSAQRLTRCATPGRAGAGIDFNGGTTMVQQYAVKFVCGKASGSIVAPGTYFTAINVHNPLYSEVAFRVKVAVALPELKAGPVSPFHDARLGPDQALEIDCPDIRKLAHQDAEFMKGFVVIESKTELDVVAVYTAAGRDGQVVTLHMERVPARVGKGGP